MARGQSRTQSLLTSYCACSTKTKGGPFLEGDSKGFVFAEHVQWEVRRLWVRDWPEGGTGARTRTLAITICTVVRHERRRRQTDITSARIKANANDQPEYLPLVHSCSALLFPRIRMWAILGKVCILVPRAFSGGGGVGKGPGNEDAMSGTQQNLCAKARLTASGKRGHVLMVRELRNRRQKEVSLTTDPRVYFRVVWVQVQFLLKPKCKNKILFVNILANITRSTLSSTLKFGMKLTPESKIF